MQLTGPGHWYHPANSDQAKHLLRRAVDHGVNHIDTADAYGPETAEHLIRKALHPYSNDLVIATKGGLARQGPNQWAPVGRPEYLRQCVEMSLRRLRLERIDVYYLHRIDPTVPLDAQLGVLADMQTEGKIRHLGLSKVDIDQIGQARRLIAIAAVQNKYHLGGGPDSVVRHCEETQTVFVAYAPLGAGQLAKQQTTLDDLARRYRATRTQLAFAWLLHCSSVILPIRGTSSETHLDDNLAAADLSLERMMQIC
jgi:aryl-alcohol dehydrogenase-like predicted oxidoreductase